MEYESSDVWLLLAVALAAQQEPADLRQIVAAGDAINHAIFTDAEFEGGLARLTAGGWIREERGRFAVTTKFRTAAGKLPRSGDKAWAQIEKLLSAKSWDRDSVCSSEEHRISYPGFSSEALGKAIKKYHQGFARTCRRPKRESLR